MSKELILKMSMSIDGFVSGPNGEIDWIFRTASEASGEWMVNFLSEAGIHAVGNKSYQGWADFWPTAPGPFAAPMNEIPKAVFSRSGEVAAPSMEKTAAAIKEGAVIDQSVLDSWLHPYVGGKDLVADIQSLKEGDGKPIVAQGGASFVSSLVAARLVDVFLLVVHPVALGQGLPIFAGLESPLDLKLEDLKQFETGVVVKTYRPL